MRNRMCVGVLSSLTLAAAASAQTVSMPAGIEASGTSGGFSTVFHRDARSYQILMNEAALQAAGMPTNVNITALAFRRPPATLPSFPFPSWPTTQLTFANWDMTLSPSDAIAGQMSSTYTNNIGAGAVMVRSGSLTLAPGAFPGGSPAPTPNPWGTDITFTTPYFYTGGSLLITIRHTGNGVSTTGHVESASAAGTQAIGVSSYTQTDSWYAQGMLALRLTVTPAGGCPDGCGPQDYNGDGDSGTDQDIEAFFACLGGTCCDTCFCGGADFNGDGDTGTDQDIEAFFRVLGGNAC
ncbi:MAG TPA: hypothetical protein VD997_14705 [Phycisphaerales bacterium]|nr:hypothetical protein [Phycisphaerales bacterium]